MREIEPNDEGIASKVFNNSDFGYHKVTIQRPKRLVVQITDEAIKSLRFDKALEVPMQWAYQQYGEGVGDTIDEHIEAIMAYCEREGIELSLKEKKRLASPDLWRKHRHLVAAAKLLRETFGTEAYDDFNLFKTKADKLLKASDLKLSATEKKSLYDAITHYDEKAVPVVKKRHKLSGEKLDALLERLKCEEDDLPHFGYYPTDKAGEYIEYESYSDLRDSETIPLGESILDYYLREVKPYVEEAWIDGESVKIGYEISFNRYFYRHKPLRPLEEVRAELLREILGGDEG